MKLLLALLLTLPLAAQRVPVGDVVKPAEGASTKPAKIATPKTEAAWKALELPTKTAELRARITALKPHCEWRDGLGLAPGPTWVDPDGGEWVAHSHQTLGTPEVWESDAEGNRSLVSGGDRIVLIPAALDAGLSGKLCIPAVSETTDRAVLGRMLKGATFARAMPKGWKMKEESQ